MISYENMCKRGRIVIFSFSKFAEGFQYPYRIKKRVYIPTWQRSLMSSVYIWIGMLFTFVAVFHMLSCMLIWIFLSECSLFCFIFCLKFCFLCSSRLMSCHHGGKPCEFDNRRQTSDQNVCNISNIRTFVVLIIYLICKKIDSYYNMTYS